MTLLERGPYPALALNETRNRIKTTCSYFIMLMGMEIKEKRLAVRIGVFKMSDCTCNIRFYCV